MNSLSYTPEDQLRNLSMAESSAQLFKAMEGSENSLEPWVTPTKKKLETSSQLKTKIGLKNSNKFTVEGTRC